MNYRLEKERIYYACRADMEIKKQAEVLGPRPPYIEPHKHGPEKSRKKIGLVAYDGFKSLKKLHRVLTKRILSKYTDPIILLNDDSKDTSLLLIRWASWHWFTYSVFHPQDARYGKAAGHRRNMAMIEACDRVIAFDDERDSAVEAFINLCREMNKPIRVVS